VRKPERAARGSQAHAVATRLRANATGIGWCRRVAGRKPHSRAKSDSSWVCPRVDTGCRSRRTTPRFREARPAGKRDVWTGTRVPETLPQEAELGFKGVDDRHRGGQAAMPGETRAGRSKGRRGAEVFARWKALPIDSLVGSFTRVGWRRSRRLSRCFRERANGHGIAGEATGVSEARYARITAGRQRPPR